MGGGEVRVEVGKEAERGKEMGDRTERGRNTGEGTRKEKTKDRMSIWE